MNIKKNIESLLIQRHDVETTMVQLIKHVVGGNSNHIKLYSTLYFYEIHFKSALFLSQIILNNNKRNPIIEFKKLNELHLQIFCIFYSSYQIYLISIKESHFRLICPIYKTSEMRFC